MIDIENNVNETDIVIISAGPAGISCTVAAGKKEYNLLLIDQGNVADAIIRFPTSMVFFSTADQLELAGLPLTIPHIRSTRVEMIKYYQDLIRMFNIRFLPQTRVLQVRQHRIMDAVFILTGYHPPTGNFQMCQVEYDRTTLEPEYNQDTLESNISGLYLAGAMLTNRDTNKIHIENSREHGSKISDEIEKKFNRYQRNYN